MRGSLHWVTSKHSVVKLGLRGSSLLPTILNRKKEPNDNGTNKSNDPCSGFTHAPMGISN
jgi:hypothetical protein